MFRLYRPTIIAMELCEELQPEYLCYWAADYLAGIIATYAGVSLTLKNAQDLESHMQQQHQNKLGSDQLIEWTKRGLGLIDGTQTLIDQMQRHNPFMASFKRPAIIPRRAIHDTLIRDVLNAVSKYDWEDSTAEISEWADNVCFDLEETMSTPPLRNDDRLTTWYRCVTWDG